MIVRVCMCMYVHTYHRVHRQRTLRNMCRMCPLSIDTTDLIANVQQEKYFFSPFTHFFLFLFFSSIHTTEFIANVQREKDVVAKQHKAEVEKQRVTGVLDPVTASLADYQVCT